MTFKGRMLLTISALIVSGFLISVIASFKVAQQQAFDSLINQEMPLTLDNVYSDIQHDLLMPQLVGSLMANDTFLHDWIAGGMQNIDEISRYLSHLKEKYGLFTAFFVSEKTRRYFYAGGLLKTISDKNPVDQWYFHFQNTEKESELNIDPDMSNSNKLAIFINVKVRNKNNNLIGITGVGLNLENVKAQFDSYYHKYAKTVYFLNKKGDLLLSGSNGAEGDNIYKKEGIKEVASQILKTNEGSFAYQYQGKHYLLITRYVKELDLFLCVEAQSGKITPALLKPFIINIVIIIFLLLTVLYLILKTIARYQCKLEKIAWQDHLTGLLNRSAFTLQYQKEASRCERQALSMVLLMIDIDFFKEINDSKGHQQGDKVLMRCAALLQEAFRLADIVARWGGEEFIVLLPDTSLSEAVLIAERLRLLVEKDVVLNKLTDNGLTISAGLSAFDAAQSMDWHINRADQQLYRAKEQGRNCVRY
ncbi:MAG: sensor domain-containing diguanylate cyclase [Psychromonas sp.]|nr:sensor domain-containing diguanylate cyclase [Psychromonas sp.]